ncbi:hypothetical protein ACH5RR_027677 [Cinchona calisaya]|uniref:CCHC-type domain-containing protein n=1 Tax=Cinchona calisaya TaxID=153742 RepID=A0ABD2YMY2_9GENT
MLEILGAYEFGEEAEGLKTLSRINEAYVDENSRPYKNIRNKHTYVLDDPFDDPPQLDELIPDASPEGKPKDGVDDDVRLQDDWLPMDESLGPQQLEEVLHAKEAHFSAIVLESIGGIPEAEAKPPDNVLFVCKLNPVTEMDNALIDDWQIHVDFSRGIAKLWSPYRCRDQMNKGKGCFRCGSLDHMARDCTGDPTNTQQHSKYILKDGNTQHGGDNNSRYEMLFDGDDPECHKGEKEAKILRA